MCGIAAYAGDRPAAPFVYEALKRLEYRGYDSWGMAAAAGFGVETVKRTGAPSESRDALTGIWETATVAIGHTRWATHGKVCAENCHPVRGGSDYYRRQVYVVHNGIVENHAELRRRLENDLGFQFRTETDTESLAHLLSAAIPTGTNVLDLVTAVRGVVDDAKGQYAFVALHRHWSRDCLICVANGSPLCITPEGHVASDPVAFTGHAKNYARLLDGHVALVWVGPGSDTPEFFGPTGVRYRPEWDTPVPPADEQGKGNRPHFMLKEILEQPDVLRAGKRRPIRGLQKPAQVVLSGCGSSYNACLLARPFFEGLSGAQTTVEYASEFRSRPVELYPKDTLFVFATQSGETKDTLLAVEHVLAKRPASDVVVLTNNEHSTAAKLAGVVSLQCGPEYGVAATKTFTATVAALAELAGAWGDLGGLTSDVMRDDLPGYLERMFRPRFLDSTKAAAEMVAKHKWVLFLGRGRNYAVAREGALKLKEVSYIHAEALPAAEMKHGPIALVDADTCSVFIATDDGSGDFEKIVSNMEEVKARGGPVLAITDGYHDFPADAAIIVRPCAAAIQPLVSNAALQLLAYYAAVGKGLNPDRPRNLAKAVTVE